MPHYQQLTELQSLKTYLDSEYYRDIVENSAINILPGNQPPWQSTNITLNKGDEFSLFALGRIAWSDKRPDLYGGPGFHLWARINPGGRIKNITAETGSFIADTNGTLEIGIYMGMWATEFGELVHQDHYSRLSGEITVVSVIWRKDAHHSLRQTIHPGPTPSLLWQERGRIDQNYQPPEGWTYLNETGHTDIFHLRTDSHGTDTAGSTGAQRQLIYLDAQSNQGIIRFPVNFPLTEQLTLSWQWRLDEHPSLGPEDRADCHDYVSVAAEFDNGRDLTWIWSRHLAQDHHFHCPVKDWTSRETHYVVRTPDDPIGSWVSETRDVHSDVLKSQGTPPANVTAIWLIAVSTFSHGRIRASYRNIEIAEKLSGKKLKTIL